MPAMDRRRFLRGVLALGGVLAAGSRGPVGRAAQRAERYPSAGPGHFIKETREGGRYVVLEDRSLWEIAEANRYTTAEWQELEGIAVRFANGDPPYDYELSNIDRDQGVAARWVRPER